jgi:hypothetical protein
MASLFPSFSRHTFRYCCISKTPSTTESMRHYNETSLDMQLTVLLVPSNQKTLMTGIKLFGCDDAPIIGLEKSVQHPLPFTVRSTFRSLFTENSK